MTGATAGSSWSGTHAAITNSVPELRALHVNVYLWFTPSSVQILLLSRRPAGARCPFACGWLSLRARVVCWLLCVQPAGGRGESAEDPSGGFYGPRLEDARHLFPQSTEQDSGPPHLQRGCEIGVLGGKGNGQDSLPDSRNLRWKQAWGV